MKKILKHYKFLDHEKINYFFFGVGITMFLLNVITIINFVIIFKLSGNFVDFALGGYYVSILSSIVLTTYSAYNFLHEKE